MVKRIAGVALLLMILMQVVPAPYRMEFAGNSTDESVDADPSVPAAVKAMLRRSCMDCHSGKTRVPWYGRVAPVSWMLARDVERGRAAMDLSRWSRLQPSMRVVLATLACEDVRTGRMPPRPYLMMHREARPSPRDIETLCRWSEELMTMARLKRRR